MMQGGSGWIYDRAVCCEDAVVSGEARICDDVMVKERKLKPPEQADQTKKVTRNLE